MNAVPLLLIYSDQGCTSSSHVLTNAIKLLMSWPILSYSWSPDQCYTTNRFCWSPCHCCTTSADVLTGTAPLSTAADMAGPALCHCPLLMMSWPELRHSSHLLISWLVLCHSTLPPGQCWATPHSRPVLYHSLILLMFWPVLYHSLILLMSWPVVPLSAPVDVLTSAVPLFILG